MSFIPTIARAARRTPQRIALPAVTVRRTPVSARRLASTSTSTSTATATATNVEKQFTSPTKDHIAQLRSFLSSKSSLISTLDGSASGDELDGFNVDWMGKYKGQSKVVVKPKTTQEVADVVKYCYEQGIAIVPQGGNTGLVGGSIPVRDELVLSLSNLAGIRSFDPVSGILVADAGVILESADNYLADQGFIFPLDLGAKGSCQIGGNVAANAGGLRLMRYGSLHGSVLGLEVVLPDGTIWNGLSKLRKDNTGFDLKQLFIGSEGTIGIITAISILCPPRPKITNVAIFSLDSYEAVQRVYTESKKHLGEILSAFEMFDAKSYEFVRKHQEESGGAKRVFETEGDFYCLIETGGSNADHDEEKMSNLVEHLMSNEMVLDGALAQDTTQAQAFWALRETITESIGKSGKVYKYDLSVPLDKMYGLVEAMRIRLKEKGYLKDDGSGEVMGCLGFGHMGDGNLHLNIVAREFKDEIKDTIEPYIYELVAENSGSISAEHGLGLMKAPYIRYSRDETAIELMKKIKTLFDPKGLLNPGKYII